MEIKRVGIVGMGTMESQIGIVCARGGFPTAMVDVSKEQVEKGLNNIRIFLNGQAKKGKINQQEEERIFSLIKADTNFRTGLFRCSTRH